MDFTVALLATGGGVMRSDRVNKESHHHLLKKAWRRDPEDGQLGNLKQGFLNRLTHDSKLIRL
jgi:hypothetical protein